MPSFFLPPRHTPPTAEHSANRRHQTQMEPANNTEESNMHEGNTAMNESQGANTAQTESGTNTEQHANASASASASASVPTTATATATADAGPLPATAAVAAPNNTPVETPPSSARLHTQEHTHTHTNTTTTTTAAAATATAGGDFAASDGGKFSGGAREGNPNGPAPGPGPGPKIEGAAHVTTAAAPLAGVTAQDLHPQGPGTSPVPTASNVRSPLRMESWMNAKVKDEEYAMRSRAAGPSITNLASSAPGSSDTFLVSAAGVAGAAISPRLPDISTLGRMEDPGTHPPSASALPSTGGNDLSRYHEQFVTSPISPPSVSMRRHSRDFVLNSSSAGSGTGTNAMMDNGLLRRERRLSADPLTMPANPPKIINSKLDGLRTRLLNNPQQYTPLGPGPGPTAKHEDVGSAAAVLSNMRSSPFGFGNGATTGAALNLPLPQGLIPSDAQGLRPHSASFSSSSMGSHSYPRPRIVINKVEGEGLIGANFQQHRRSSAAVASESDSQGDSSNDSESYSDDEYEEGGEEGQGQGQGQGQGKKHRKKHRFVTWNKNGKRINKFQLDNEKGRVATFLVDPSDGVDGPGANLEDGAKKDKKRKKSSSASSASGRQPALSPEALKANISGARHSFRVITDPKRGKHAPGGSRSRTGCWICRLRKKKCTEEKPTCVNCQRLNLTCYYDEVRPDFVADPVKKAEKLAEIRMSTREAKRDAMKRRAFGQPPY